MVGLLERLARQIVGQHVVIAADKAVSTEHEH